MKKSRLPTIGIGGTIYSVAGSLLNSSLMTIHIAMLCLRIIGSNRESSRFLSHISRTSICSRWVSNLGIFGIGSFDLFWAKIEQLKNKIDEIISFTLSIIWN